MREVKPNHLASTAEKLLLGKSRRRVLSRVDQGICRVIPNRPDPIGLILEADRGRLENLLPIKYGRHGGRAGPSGEAALLRSLSRDASRARAELDHLHDRKRES